jgi:RNA polymerase sigma-70 factor (ECF subfamily)
LADAFESAAAPGWRATLAPMPSPSEPRAEFRTTRWSLVERVRSNDLDARRAALETLFAVYWPALYAYARRCGEPAESAADLVQGFCAELLARGNLERLEREGGRLRAWLKQGLRHHRANCRRAQGAAKRGGVAARIDLVAAERRLAADAAEASDPELAFDRAFAAALLEAAQARLTSECDDARSRALLPHLAANPDAAARAELAKTTGLGDGALRVALHRLRRRYAELVRAELTEVCVDPASVQQELCELRLSFEPRAPFEPRGPIDPQAPAETRSEIR